MILFQIELLRNHVYFSRGRNLVKWNWMSGTSWFISIPKQNISRFEVWNPKRANETLIKWSFPGSLSNPAKFRNSGFAVDSVVRYFWTGCRDRVQTVQVQGQFERILANQHRQYRYAWIRFYMACHFTVRSLLIALSVTVNFSIPNRILAPNSWMVLFKKQTSIYRGQNRSHGMNSIW